MRFLWKPHQAHPSIKYSMITFHTLDAPECTT
jgi:hypothetical protein